MASWPYNTENWQRLRKRKLSLDPFCYPCSLRGRHVVASTVDHVKAIADGGPAFPALSGLMSMCARCHNEKTNALDRPDRHGSGRRFKGFDLAGNPIDPADAWHGGSDHHGEGSPAGPAPTSRTDILLNRGGKKWG
ncbi:HNH endonuclease [Neoaquamicrobium sediminum]|uniref:HNH endonuclease n=1 Tax=Neoaquamicrobium sediminum TaxID=1849104 RepID=UPI00360D292A